MSSNHQALYESAMLALRDEIRTIKDDDARRRLLNLTQAVDFAEMEVHAYRWMDGYDAALGLGNNQTPSGKIPVGPARGTILDHPSARREEKALVSDIIQNGGAA